MLKVLVSKCRDAAKVVIEYSTDGCTLVPNFNFRECCVQHDQDYAENHRTSEKKRAEIDKELRFCIKCKAGATAAWVYWAGSKVFGWIPFWVMKRRDRLSVEEDQDGHS